jgi:hypothetical protein
LSKLPELEECAHYGSILRVALRGHVDAEQITRQALDNAGVRIDAVRATRATVEDAFVSMVRREHA